MSRPIDAQLMSRFADALALLAVIHQSLTTNEDANAGDEAAALRIAAAILQKIYEELDRPAVSGKLSRRPSSVGLISPL